MHHWQSSLSRIAAHVWPASNSNISRARRVSSACPLRLAARRLKSIRSASVSTILFRLLHHSTTIDIRGESYRLKDRCKGGLVPPRRQEGAEATPRSLASDCIKPRCAQQTALVPPPSDAKESHL
jgi:hypothetical protein